MEAVALVEEPKPHPDVFVLHSPRQRLKGCAAVFVLLQPRTTGIGILTMLTCRRFLTFHMMMKYQMGTPMANITIMAMPGATYLL